jgi:hypothetical protein
MLIRRKVAQLLDAGGTVVCEDYGGAIVDHVVMADPEGNQFCVA